MLPFNRFAGADSLLGPEMRSTGEVMGIARDFPTAFAKAQAAAGAELPDRGTVFITVADGDKPAATGHRDACSTTSASGSSRPRGTAQAIRRMGIPAEAINKIGEGSPHVVDWIERGEVDLVINTPVGTGARTDGYEIRTAAVARGIPCITTMAGGMAAARAIAAARRGEPEVLSLQEIHAHGRRVSAGSRELRGRAALAPFGRRRRRSPSGGATAPTSCSAAPTASGPRPQPGQFYMLAAASRWGGGRASGRSCRARSACCERPPARRRAPVPGRGRRPRDQAAVRARRRATSCCSSARSGIGFAPPRERPPRRCSSAAASGSRRSRSGRTSCGDRDAGAARLPRRARTRPARRCCAARASPPTTAASATTGSSPSCSPTSSTDGATRSRSTPAGRRRCSRRSGRICAERGVPAQLALESGMACGFGACFGCVVADPRRLRPPVRRRARCSTRSGSSTWNASDPSGSGTIERRLLRDRARAPDHQRLGDVRRDRRAPRVRRRAARALPVRRVRLQDRHASSRARATRRRGCGSCRAG